MRNHKIEDLNTKKKVTHCRKKIELLNKFRLTSKVKFGKVYENDYRGE